VPGVGYRDRDEFWGIVSLTPFDLEPEVLRLLWDRHPACPS